MSIPFRFTSRFLTAPLKEASIKLSSKFLQANQLTKYTAIKKYSEADATQEFNEELADWGPAPFNMRFPGVKKEQVPFFFDPKKFAQKVAATQVTYPSLQQIQRVYNFAQAVDTAEEIEKGGNLENLAKENESFFSERTTDKDAEGKTHNKGESFNRWRGIIRAKTPILPTILLHCNGRYYQVVGQTRLVAGMTLGYLMPCLVLEADKTNPVRESKTSSLCPTLYHGTLKKYLPKILKDGLKVTSGYGGADTHGVYLASSPDIAAYWAKMHYIYNNNMSEEYEFDRKFRDKESPVSILEVRIPDSHLHNLKADMEQAEDVQFDGTKDDWQLSLEQMGDVMYEGPIPAAWIRAL